MGFPEGWVMSVSRDARCIGFGFAPVLRPREAVLSARAGVLGIGWKGESRASGVVRVGVVAADEGDET